MKIRHNCLLNPMIDFINKISYKNDSFDFQLLITSKSFKEQSSNTC